MSNQVRNLSRFRRLCRRSGLRRAFPVPLRYGRTARSTCSSTSTARTCGGVRQTRRRSDRRRSTRALPGPYFGGNRYGIGENGRRGKTRGVVPVAGRDRQHHERPQPGGDRARPDGQCHDGEDAGRNAGAVPTGARPVPVYHQVSACVDLEPPRGLEPLTFCLQVASAAVSANVAKCRISTIYACQRRPWVTSTCQAVSGRVGLYFGNGAQSETAQARPRWCTTAPCHLRDPSFNRQGHCVTLARWPTVAKWIT